VQNTLVVWGHLPEGSQEGGGLGGVERVPIFHKTSQGRRKGEKRRKRGKLRLGVNMTGAT